MSAPERTPFGRKRQRGHFREGRRECDSEDTFGRKKSVRQRRHFLKEEVSAPERTLLKGIRECAREDTLGRKK